MKRKLLLGLGIFLLVVVAALALIGRDMLKDLKQNALEAEAKMNLATIYTSEQAFGREYFKFSADLEELGFVPEGNGDIQYFLDADDIPADLKLKLNPDELPMVADDGFRALAIITRDDGITLLTIDRDKKISVRRD